MIHPFGETIINTELCTCTHDSRDPNLANQEALKGLTRAEQQQAQLDTVVRLGKLYVVNRSTPSIWEHLISLVESKGSLAGMLESTTAPLCHSGYSVPALTRSGCDLEFLNSTPAAAAALCQQYIAAIDTANRVLYSQLPSAPARPLLLHGVVDLLCMDADAVRAAFAAPGAQLRQSMATAATALVSVLSSTASAAAAGARGDEAEAARTAGQAAAAALQAVRDAGLLQPPAGQGGAAAAGAQGPREAAAWQGGAAAAAAAAAGQGDERAAATVERDQQAEAAAVEEGPGGAAAEEGGLAEEEPMDWQAVARDMAWAAVELASPPAASPVGGAGRARDGT